MNFMQFIYIFTSVHRQASQMQTYRLVQNKVDHFILLPVYGKENSVTNAKCHLC